MERVNYSVEQIKTIVSLLNQIEVKGSTSITSLAMVFQELNNGDVITVEEGEEDGTD